MAFQGIQKKDFIESINIVLSGDSSPSLFVPLKGCCPAFYPLTPGVCVLERISEPRFFSKGRKNGKTSLK